MEDRTPLSRRRFLKKLALGTGFLALLSTPFYSFYVERNWIQINEVTIPILPSNSSFSGLKMVHISDLHYGYYMNQKHLNEIVQKVNALQPDVVCFTGDFIDREVQLLEKAGSILSEIKASIGKFAVLGNHDYALDVARLEDFYSDAGFSLLINQRITVEKNKEKLHFVGVDDALMGNPHLEEACAGIPSNEPIVLLAHEPVYADQAKSIENIKLQLSGHTHGGQIRLPFYGHLVVPPLGEKYVQGLHQVENSDLWVYTSRGLGTTIFPIRFNCRPEITVIELS